MGIIGWIDYHVRTYSKLLYCSGTDLHNRCIFTLKNQASTPFETNRRRLGVMTTSGTESTIWLLNSKRHCEPIQPSNLLLPIVTLLPNRTIRYKLRFFPLLFVIAFEYRRRVTLPHFLVIGLFLATASTQDASNRHPTSQNMRKIRREFPSDSRKSFHV